MVWFDSILLLFSLTLLHFPSSHHIHYSLYSNTDGKIYHPSWDFMGTVERVNVGDLWEMEVDLRSREKEKRTLHFFVRGKQQIWSLIFHFLLILILSIQICTGYTNDSFEFISLEELKEPSVKSIPEEKESDWVYQVGRSY